MDFNQPPVVTISRYDDAEIPQGEYPADIPAVAQLLRDGLKLDPGITFLVGENGSGKSTLLEGIALAFGFSPEGGSIYAEHSTRPSESELHDWLRVQRGIGAARWGYFLRAETTHSLFTYLEDNPTTSHFYEEPEFHAMSHGESFLTMFGERFSRPGFYCMDEPEAALSFDSTLKLLTILDEIRGAGGQALIATHSPVLATLPGATILEVGPWGMRRLPWEDLELVDHWRRFMESPQRYLRHLLD